MASANKRKRGCNEELPEEEEEWRNDFAPSPAEPEADPAPLHTPPPKRPRPPDFNSPNSVINSTRSYSVTHSPSTTITATSPHGGRLFSSRIRAASYGILEESSGRYPEVGKALNLLRLALEPILKEKMTKLLKEKLTAQSGLEAAALIDLLELVGASKGGLEDDAEIARKAAQLMEEGERQLNDAKKSLESVFANINKHFRPEN